MDKYNQDQLGLVDKCEEAWYYGLRHAGISGEIAEALLTEYLRKKFPKLYFFKGIVKEKDLVGRELRKAGTHRKQIDIIASKSKPDYENAGFGVTTKDKVLCCIEVKKWVAPKDFTGIRQSKENQPHNKQILRIKKEIGKPVIYVGFRYHNRIRNPNSLSMENIKKLSKADATFILSGKTKAAPREIGWPEQLEKALYSGELERLVNYISKLK